LHHIIIEEEFNISIDDDFYSISSNFHPYVVTLTILERAKYKVKKKPEK